MMRSQIYTTLSAVALLAALAGNAQATKLTFNTTPYPGNNVDIPVAYGSNIGVATPEFEDGGEGMTPNIALSWAPTGGAENASDPNGDVLEWHNASTFTGAGLTVPVLQLDVDVSNHAAVPAHPTVDFIPDPGYAVEIFEFEYGNATDQGTQAPHAWTFSILELPGLTPTGYSVTTAALGAGDHGIATFNFTGAPGVSYQLLMDDGDDTGDPSFDLHNPRTGFDNLRIGQIPRPIPEPSTLALVALCGLGLLGTRSRESL